MIKEFVIENGIKYHVHHYKNGDVKWYFLKKNGKSKNLILHRELGPAHYINYYDIAWEHKWYWNGNLHNENGPAVIHSDGCVKYYRFNKLHRLDGPAMENARWKNSQNWFIDGKEIYVNSQKDFEKYVKTLVLM